MTETKFWTHLIDSALFIYWWFIYSSFTLFVIYFSNLSQQFPQIFYNFFGECTKHFLSVWPEGK